MRESLFFVSTCFHRSKNKANFVQINLNCTNYENKLPDSFIALTPYSYLGW